jgi:hypothetical protein
MQRARHRTPVGCRQRQIGRARDGTDPIAADEALPHASSMADRLDNAAACPRPPLAPGSRGKVERAFSWLAEELVFGPRRLRHRRPS